jgi:hypothetical protein
MFLPALEPRGFAAPKNKIKTRKNKKKQKCRTQNNQIIEKNNRKLSLYKKTKRGLPKQGTNLKKN